MERMYTVPGTTPEEYLQRTSLRPMLASLLERTCKDKPDNLLPFMLEYLQTTYPDASQSANPINAPGSFGTWARRTDVQPTEAGLQAYLTQIKARVTLESVLEQALRMQPANVVAFVIESLCAGDDLLAAPTGGAAPSTAAGSTAAASVYAEVATRQEAHPEAPLLFEAVGEGDLERIEQLLSSGVPVDSLNEDAATALLVAAEGEPAIVALLLGEGCDVDHQSRDGGTALIAAIKYEDPEIVEMLIAAGASRELTDVGGMSAVDHAVEGGDSRVLEKLGLASSEATAASEPAVPPAKAERRTGVSSESIDPKAKIDTSTIKVVPKDEATKARIKVTVGNNLLFKALDREQLEAVVMSMEEVEVRQGEAVITQGDAGNHFYVVDSGTFECFVKRADDGLEDPRGRLVLSYAEGSTFGELALMYNTPRAASIVASSDSVLWAMDRETFRTVILQVPLLRSMEAYERTAVADAFEEQSYAAGEVILREAEQGDTFYLLVSGTAAATKAGGEGRRLLLEYKEGDYFGELALLNNRPRAASVECLTDCTCVHLARPIFERLLGPVIHILKRNAENYKSYEDCQ